MMKRATLVLMAACLAGCSTIGGLTGAVAGIATGAATGNPAAAIGVGIAVKTATDAVGKAAGRRLQQTEQDEIAATVGDMSLGEARPWQTRHPLALGSRRGEVRVTRVLATPLALCKEIVFSVARGDGPDAAGPWFTASVCQQASRWKWAGAEPAVERWGSLQ